MKKDDWIKLAIGTTFVWVVTGGVAYMQSFIDLAFFLVPTGLLIAFFYICIKYFSEPDIRGAVKKIQEDLVSSWKRIKESEESHVSDTISLLRKGVTIKTILDKTPEALSDPNLEEAFQIASEMERMLMNRNNSLMNVQGIGDKDVDALIEKTRECALTLSGNRSKR